MPKIPQSARSNRKGAAWLGFIGVGRCLQRDCCGGGVKVGLEHVVRTGLRVIMGQTRGDTGAATESQLRAEKWRERYGYEEARAVLIERIIVSTN